MSAISHPMLVTLACPLLLSARETHRNATHEPGLTTELLLDYDSSRARTNHTRAGFEVEWGTAQTWISLAGDMFTDFSHAIDLREDGYVTLQVGHALYRNNEQRLYWNAMLDIDPHSQLASRGWDLTPKLGVAWGMTEDWWIGGEAGAVLATSADEGNRMGYPSLSLWVTWLCGFTAKETDTLSLSLWAAGNEIPDEDNALFLELEYTFDLTENLEAAVGLGTDPISPWDHLGLYLTAGLKWTF